ncbi:hypothetical protein CK501_15660 [Halovibrio salipaludis]|uniref:DUF4168 domain-containing protein n=1 Tax=Halovibrio salipaludis TaxID=2032626 RepID=A0A2A2EUA4_9GAMM|nr:hypothetical protein [Halovibrio salipaludis]PAU77001.1 hypothetical protein CK501_15660 [Halovibrio salipaludis]
MNLVTWRQGLCCLAMVVLLVPSALGETRLTPEVYVDIRLSALALTVEGIQQRLTRLKESPYDNEDQRRVGRIVQSEVDRVFEENGVTKRAFLEYGAEHAGAIEAWLNENPSVARRFSDLKARRSSLSKQIKALKEE